ncbi:hypothetical protein SO802_022640 [Lithocarpus litseifolius]|uniref:Pentatricopeptide repeat-containing protein n=1 Tax=Lithocarpus litseifolius TaxID=425828 RepID=A0AAW2C4C2_9ROSI
MAAHVYRTPLLSKVLERETVQMELTVVLDMGQRDVAFYLRQRTSKPKYNCGWPDLQAHLALICRLVRERRFSDAEKMIKFVLVGGNPRYPFSVIAATVGNCCNDEKVIAKFFNSMLKVYSDCKMFDLVSRVFDNMKDNGIEIDESSCTVQLLALKKSYECLQLVLDFFYRMVESGIEVSVYSLTVVVDGLCWSGEVKRGRLLVEEMIGRRMKTNVVTFDVMVNACAKRWNFEELELALLLMGKEGVAFSDHTYKVLIDGFTSSGKIDEAKKLVLEMHDKGLKVATHLYNLVINGYSRLGLMDGAKSMYGEMTDRSIFLNADTYSSLISGLCKAGKMGLAMTYVNMIQRKGIELDDVMFNSLFDGFCNKGMVDEAFEVQVMMEKKGFAADLTVFDKIVSGLCKLKRIEEAKRLLNVMVKREASNPVPLPNHSNLETSASGCEQSYATANLMLQEQEHEGLEEEDDDEPVFVLTDEWREFFAKSEAKRKLAKKQAKKNGKK